MQLPGFGEAKQRLLQQSKVLLVGAGGLGCPAAQYLVSSGVGNITIADFDKVSVSNLHRQVLYTPDDVGLYKAEVAAKKLKSQNPMVNLVALTEKITSANVLELVSRHDVIVDGSDNFETRYLVNDACVLSQKPLVYGAIYQYEGQLALWNCLNEDGSRSPNYRDVFPEVNADLIPNCADGGVIPSLAGIIGCMQANETIKLITGTGVSLAGKMYLLDAQSLQGRIIHIGSASKVPVYKLPLTIGVHLVSAGDLLKHMEAHSVELIDVRTADERSAFHIGGKHISMDRLENAVAEIDTGKPVVFYCATGMRSVEAAKLLSNKVPGSEVYSLDGGLKAWKQEMHDVKPGKDKTG